MKNKVAYIIPVYNVNKYLRECLDSVKKITTSKEIIIVDDRGSEDPYPIISEFLEDKHFKYVKNRTNLGLGFARNEGVKNISKDVNYIYFLDSDDVVDYKTIDEQVNKLDGISSYLRKTIYHWTKNKTWVSSENFAKHNSMVPFGSTGSFWNRNIPSTIPFWLKTYEDAPWTLKVSNQAKENNWTFKSLEKPNYVYRMRKSSITNSNMTAKKVNDYKALRDYLVLHGSKSVDRKFTLYKRYFMLNRDERFEVENMPKQTFRIFLFARPAAFFTKRKKQKLNQYFD